MLKILFHFQDKTDINELLNKFESESNLEMWINGLRSFMITIIEMVDRSAKGQELSMSEMLSSNFLKWSIFKNGVKEGQELNAIADYSDEEDLTENGKVARIQLLMKQSKYSYLQQFIEDDKFRLLKEDLISRVTKGQVIKNSLKRAKKKEGHERKTNFVR